MKSGTPAGLLCVLCILANTTACWRTDVYLVTADSGMGAGGAADGGTTGVVPSAGCGKASTIAFAAVPNQDPSAAPGSGHTLGHGVGGYVTLQSSGKTRTFTMRLPDDYDPNHPYWLSFTFHPAGGNTYGIDNGGNNGYVMAYYGLQNLSNNGAFFVAPDGLNGGWANSNGEDLKFVDDMVELIEDNYCIDTTHLFAQGFAWGGGMTYEIACARAKVFRGVAIYEGAVFSGCDNGNDPIAYWQMVGLTDSTCTIDLARPMRDQFAKNNGCTLPATEPPEPPQPPPYLNPGGHAVHGLRRMFQRPPPALVRASVRSRQRHRRRDLGFSTTRARRLPRPARPRVLAPGFRKTCGPG